MAYLLKASATKRALALALVCMMALALVPVSAGAAAPAATATVSGTVTVDGAPLADAFVDLYSYDLDDYPYATEITDLNGKYAFTGVAPGVYAVEVYDADGNFITAVDVNVTGAGTYTVDVAYNTPIPVIEGTVTNEANGQPIAEAEVTAWEYDADFGEWFWADFAITEATGEYVFTNEYLNSGVDYLVSFDGPGFMPELYDNLAMTAFPEGTLLNWDGGAPITGIDAALTPGTVTPQRVAAATRFSGSAAVAAMQLDMDPTTPGTQWQPDVYNIVIASGEDRAAADPLSAAGLCGVYGAPLFLVSSSSVEQPVKQAIKDMVAASDGPVTIHVVGGKMSVPDARVNEILAYCGAGSKLTSERVLAGGSRYDLAAAIARRMVDEMGVPSTVLVANGADQTKFFDALSLSPLSYYQEFPILLVEANAIPAATQATIDELKKANPALDVIVGGGAKTVSDTVKGKLGATRWAGSTRYSTATTIADNAIDMGWLSATSVGVAAKLPDALTGGTFLGSRGGVLVLTDGASLSDEAGSWLSSNKSFIEECFLLGGEKSLTKPVAAEIAGILE